MLKLIKWPQYEYLFRSKYNIPGMVLAVGCVRIPYNQSNGCFNLLLGCRADGFIEFYELFKETSDAECLRRSSFYRDVILAGILPSFLPMRGEANARSKITAYVGVGLSFDIKDDMRTHIVSPFASPKPDEENFNRVFQEGALKQIDTLFSEMQEQWGALQDLTHLVEGGMDAEDVVGAIIPLHNFSRGLQEYMDEIPVKKLRRTAPTSANDLKPRESLKRMFK